MPESESGGPKKPPKSASPAAKAARPAAKKPPKGAATKPARTAAKDASKKPAKASAKPTTAAAKSTRAAAKPSAPAAKSTARKPPKVKAAGTASKSAGAATRKPPKVVSATPGGAVSGPATAKKARAGTRSPAKAAGAPGAAKKPRSAAPKVTPAVAPPKPVPVAAETPVPPAAEKPAAPAAVPTPSPTPETSATGAGERKVVHDTARGYFDALAARDPDAAVAFWSPEGVDDILPLRILRGPKAIREFLHQLFTAAPDMRFTVERITADEKVAAVQWRSAGTFTSGTFEGLEPTGRRVELRGIDCLEVVDGKIVHNTGVFDGAAFARQVGLLPPEESGADRAIRAGFNTVTKLRRSVAKRTAR